MMRVLMDQRMCFTNDLNERCKMDPCWDAPYCNHQIKEEKEEYIEMMSL